MHLNFNFKRAKSHFTKKGNLTKKAPIHHTQVPDCDNLAKHIMDSLNSHVYIDDKQICELRVTKHWSITDSTEVVIFAVDDGVVQS